MSLSYRDRYVFLAISIPTSGSSFRPFLQPDRGAVLPDHLRRRDGAYMGASAAGPLLDLLVPGVLASAAMMSASSSASTDGS